MSDWEQAQLRPIGDCCESLGKIDTEKQKEYLIRRVNERDEDELLIDLVHERAQVGHNIKRLKTVLEIPAEKLTIGVKQRGFMQTQLTGMECYYGALGDRIVELIRQ